MDISLRPLARSDIPAWADLLAAIEKVDCTGEHFAAADLAEEMNNPEVEVGKDFVGAFDAGGELVGYYSILPRGAADGHYKVHVQGSVLPARRAQGIGTLLVTAMVGRAARARDERRPDLRARLVADGLSSDTAQADLLASVGMQGERWTFLMRTPLDALPPVRPLAAGYRLRGYDGSMTDALRQAHNAAFLDHPDFTPWSEVMWKQSVTESRSFRPDLCFVVSPNGSDEIVAYLETAEFEADFAATGRREAYVGKVGTLRGHRGKGLASALLGQALHAYREAGYDEASLAVDSENPTGALGVYQRAGFAVESRWTNYAMMIDASASGAAAGEDDHENRCVQTEIRPETRDDQAAIRDVVRAAFDHDPSVAVLVDLIRESPGFVPELSLVACRADEVVGHVMLSRAELVDELGVGRWILTLSPLAVAPAVQGNGVGSALVRAGLAAAEGLGEQLVVLQGSPGYYPRFGFRDCRALGIEMRLPDWAPADAGMAYPLSTYDRSLRGRLIEPPAFAALE